MKLVTVMLVTLACGAGAACREDNPYYDPNATDDVDGSVDSSPACTGDGDCTGETPACDTGVHACVECTVTNVTACDPGDVCGADHTCQPCAEDSQCTTSHVCLASGQCADPARVIYVQPTGGDDSGGCGAEDRKCTFARALDIADATRDIIKLDPGGYQTADNATGFAIDKTITIAATDTMFVRTPVFTNPPPIFTVQSGADLTILGGRITGGPGDGIYCTNASVHLWRTVVDLMRGVGVNASLCDLEIVRAHVDSNDMGGILMASGARKVTLTNTFITRNGRGSTPTFNPGVTLVAAAGSVVAYNTIADNMNTSMPIKGLQCQAQAGNAIVEHNLFYRNDATGCDQHENYSLLEDTMNQPMFRFLSGTFDYHLTAQSPVPAVKDAFDCDAGIDQEGQARPYGGKCDFGADEYMP